MNIQIQSKQDFLVHRLALLARAGLSEANSGNPFWSKRDAMQAINGSRNLMGGSK